MNGERRVRASVERRHETITVPLDFEPKPVRFDPGSFLLADVRYRLGADLAAATLARRSGRHCPHPRAARELAKDGGRVAREAIARVFAREPFWGGAGETALRHRRDARAVGSRDSYFGTLASASKSRSRGSSGVRRAFRERDSVTALIETAANHASYFVRAAALGALGKTRDARAFDVL